ncbi:MAG TPA: TrmH family RNA methyltransferase [Candidatus Limnocylindrales bacterium]|nr:TrmH family RNA methyltransferase [Candidatus Limnocylindrales bacterium]
MPAPAVTIESSANPRIKAALALRDRKGREAAGLTLVDGGREALRAFNAGAAVETAFVCRSLMTGDDARRVVEKVEQSFGPFGAAIELVEVGERAFERLAFGDRTDGVVLVVRVPERGLDDLALPDAPLLVVTEDVEKPGNLGAILRTADAVAADAVIAAGGTDLYNPNVIRASIGTVFSLQVAAAPASGVVAWLRLRGVRIVASRVDAARLHVDADLTGPVALVLGSEAEGLSEAWRGADVEGIRLPMLGVADSLNVSAAGAVLLYEAWRQRRAST